MEADEEYARPRRRRNLRPAECVDGVVHRELSRHVVEVVPAGRLEARRRGVEPCRLGRERPVVGIRASHDGRERGEGRIGELVALDERVERAAWTVMTELDVGNVVRNRGFALRDVSNLVRWDEQEFRLWIDEPRDQPRTGDAIDTRALAGYPLHADLLIIVKG